MIQRPPIPASVPRRREAEEPRTAPARRRRGEFEYERGGAPAYAAARDVRRAKVFGLCLPPTGIEPYPRPVDLVMRPEP